MKKGKKETLRVTGFALACLVGLLVLMLLGGVFNDKANAGERRMKLVMKVDAVELNVIPGKVPRLHISASGEVGSTGWTDPVLVPVDTDCPKSFKCFEFRAKPPIDPVPTVITPISADYTLDDWEFVKKIKVVSETNALTVDVEESE